VDGGAAPDARGDAAAADGTDHLDLPSSPAPQTAATSLPAAGPTQVVAEQGVGLTDPAAQVPTGQVVDGQVAAQAGAGQVVPAAATTENAADVAPGTAQQGTSPGTSTVQAVGPVGAVATDAATPAPAPSGAVPGAAQTVSPVPADPAQQTPAGAQGAPTVPTVGAHPASTSTVPSPRPEAATDVRPVHDTSTAAPFPVTSAPAVASTPAGQRAVPAAPVATMVDQLGPHLRALSGAKTGTHVLSVLLDPESLGDIRIVAHISADQVRIDLTGAGDDARSALRQSLDDLRRDLQNAGFDAELGLDVGHGSAQRDSEDARPTPTHGRPEPELAPASIVDPAPTGSVHGLDLIV
jgi:flagellar hook-length control protein FliK